MKNEQSKPPGEVGFEEGADKEEVPEVVVEDEEEKKHQEALAAVEASKQIYDPYDEFKGSSLTFTYKEGLVAKVLPNGDIS